MKVVVTAIGTNHYFHMASQLERLGLLECIYTGYPRSRVQSRGVSPERIRTFPWFQTLYMARGKVGIKSRWLERQLCHVANRTLDRHVARTIPECDIFIGQSNCGLFTGRRVQSRGGKYVCDRPCAHIRVQDRLLREEYGRHGLPYSAIDPRIIEREEQEYAGADAILIASKFAYDSFLGMGFPAERLLHIPYGVDTSRFRPTGEPRFERFTILFAGNASLQKGVPDLLRAFSRLNIPERELVFVGHANAEVMPMIESARNAGSIRVLGARPQSELPSLMSRSHVLVLPSVHEGFGMVIAEALACGLPVIASTNSGGPDMIVDGSCGYIVPPRSPEVLAERIKALYTDPSLHESMAEAALARVSALGSWDAYGDALAHACKELSSRSGVAA